MLVHQASPSNFLRGTGRTLQDPLPVPFLASKFRNQLDYDNEERHTQHRAKHLERLRESQFAFGFTYPVDNTGDIVEQDPQKRVDSPVKKCPVERLPGEGLRWDARRDSRSLFRQNLGHLVQEGGGRGLKVDERLIEKKAGGDVHVSVAQCFLSESFATHTDLAVTGGVLGTARPGEFSTRYVSRVREHPYPPGGLAPPQPLRLGGGLGLLGAPPPTRPATGEERVWERKHRSLLAALDGNGAETGGVGGPAMLFMADSGEEGLESPTPAPQPADQPTVEKYPRDRDEDALEAAEGDVLGRHHRRPAGARNDAGEPPATEEVDQTGEDELEAAEGDIFGRHHTRTRPAAETTAVDAGAAPVDGEDVLEAAEGNILGRHHTRRKKDEDSPVPAKELFSGDADVDRAEYIPAAEEEPAWREVFPEQPPPAERRGSASSAEEALSLGSGPPSDDIPLRESEQKKPEKTVTYAPIPATDSSSSSFQAPPVESFNVPTDSDRATARTLMTNVQRRVITRVSKESADLAKEMVNRAERKVTQLLSEAESSAEEVRRQPPLDPRAIMSPPDTNSRARPQYPASAATAPASSSTRKWLPRAQINIERMEDELNRSLRTRTESLNSALQRSEYEDEHLGAIANAELSPEFRRPPHQRSLDYYLHRNAQLVADDTNPGKSRMERHMQRWEAGHAWEAGAHVGGGKISVRSEGDSPQELRLLWGVFRCCWLHEKRVSKQLWGACRCCE